MNPESRIVAGTLLILRPTIFYEGTRILSLMVNDPGYAENQLRQDLWRAGHAHAGVLLVLSLVTLRYVVKAALSGGMWRLVRHSIPASAALLSTAFFLSILSPDATEPNALIYLAYAEAVSLTVGLLVLEPVSSVALEPLSTLQQSRIVASQTIVRTLQETGDRGTDDSQHHSLLRSCISKTISC